MGVAMGDDELSKLRFLAVYQARRRHLDRVLGQLTAYLEEFRKTVHSDPIHRIHSVRGRVKDGESLWRKWKKKVLDASDEQANSFKGGDLANGKEIYEAMVVRFSDIIGVRVVCNTLAGKARVRARLEELGPITRDDASRNLFSKVIPADKFYKDSGYRSLHFDAKLMSRNWPTLALDQSDEDERLTVEIQVRTILEEAWGEIEHDLRYKSLDKGGQSEPLFLALSHRLHEADLNVQRLTRKLEARPDEGPRLKPSVQESIPANTDAFPLAFRDSARTHLLEVEQRRRHRDHSAAIEAHDRYLEQHPEAPGKVRGVILAERALDRLRSAERLKAKRQDATALLAQAELDYDDAMKELGDDNLFLWRRSRVRYLRNDLSGAISDLQTAIAHLPEEIPAYRGESFYHACLHRALTGHLWRRAEAIARSDPSTAEELKEKAYDIAMQAVHIQNAEFRHKSKSEACALHYCDVLNNAAWITMMFKRDLAGAEAYIDIIERNIAPSLWEHNVFLLGTRLRLKVTKLKRRLDARDGLEIGHIVEADALRTQLFQALVEQEEYVPEAIVESMLATVRTLDKVWQSFVRRSTGLLDMDDDSPGSTLELPAVDLESLGLSEDAPSALVASADAARG
jgi:ppGpp synthetase/RelA/SpoT-type nucleotidyltranferase